MNCTGDSECSFYSFLTNSVQSTSISSDLHALIFQLSGRQVSDKSSPWTGNMRQDMSPAQRHADHRTRTTWADTVVLVQKRSGKEWSDQCSGLLRLPQVIYPKQTPSVAKTATFATFKNVWEKCGLSLLTLQNLWGVVPGSKYLMGVVLLYSQRLDSKNMLGTVCRVFQATMRYAPSQMYTQKPWTWAVYVLRDKTFASQNLFKTIALQRKKVHPPTTSWT